MYKIVRAQTVYGTYCIFTYCIWPQIVSSTKWIGAKIVSSIHNLSHKIFSSPPVDIFMYINIHHWYSKLICNISQITNPSKFLLATTTFKSVFVPSTFRFLAPCNCFRILTITLYFSRNTFTLLRFSNFSLAWKVAFKSDFIQKTLV